MNAPAATGSKSLGLNPMESMVLALLAILVGVGIMFFVAGELSGIIFSFDRPGAHPSDIPGIIGGILTNPGNPAHAWPKEFRGAVPGPVPYYLTLIFLIVGTVVGFKYAKELYDGNRKKDPNAAQWAKNKDIKTLVVPGPGIKGRLILGRTNGKLVATEPRQSVIVLGPTQTGKTTGFAVPAILDWQGPVIAASVKNDLVKDTFKWRQTQGEVWLFDPTRATGFDYEDVRAGWSPLSQAIDWGGARKVASWLSKANKAAGGGLSDGDFWFSIAEKALAPYLFAASYAGLDMSTVLRWIDTMEEREVLNILQTTGVPEAMTAFRANMARDERTKSSVFTTAETIVNAYNDPLVCESAANPTIFASELLNGKNNTLYICAPSHEQDRLQTIFTAIVTQMKSAAYELAGKQNKIIDPPLLIVIDEAANIAPLDDLDAIASTAAGIGIQLVTIFQDMAQIEARYKERARTVVNNHRAKVVLSGISDSGTLEYVSKLIGEEEIDSTSVSISAQGERSTTESKQQRTLASGSYLRRMKFGEGIVVYGQLAPAKLVLRAWYKDKDLKHKVEHGTLPGVMGGRAGTNFLGSGGAISKAPEKVPGADAVPKDENANTEGGNQGPLGPGVVPGGPAKWSTDSSGPEKAYSTPVSGAGAPGVPGAGGYETQHRPSPAIPGMGAGQRLSEPVSDDQLSAFDKALAELRLRDQGGAATQGGAPSQASPTPGVPLTSGHTLIGESQTTSLAPSASPSKWKPSGGGVPDENEKPGGVAPSVSPEAKVPDIDYSLPTPSSDSTSSSKWSKGSRPAFSSPAPAQVPATSAPIPTPAPAPAQVPATPAAVVNPAPVTPAQVMPPVAPIQSEHPKSTWGAAVTSPTPIPQAVKPEPSQTSQTEEAKADEVKKEGEPKSKWK